MIAHIEQCDVLIVPSFGKHDPQIVSSRERPSTGHPPGQSMIPQRRIKRVIPEQFKRVDHGVFDRQAADLEATRQTGSNT